MGLREHQLKVDAKDAIQRLRVTMCDADDFAPDDAGAKTRSDQAKLLAVHAESYLRHGQYEAAIQSAKDAIRIMEGN